MIKEEADLQGAGLRLSPLPDLSRLVRPRGLRTECARAQAQRKYCRRKRARDAEALSAGRLRDLGVEEVDLADGGVDGAPATCSTNAASGITGVDRAASFGRRRVVFACLRHSPRRSSSHSLRTRLESTPRWCPDSCFGLGKRPSLRPLPTDAGGRPVQSSDTRPLRRSHLAHGSGPRRSSCRYVGLPHVRCCKPRHPCHLLSADLRPGQLGANGAISVTVAPT